MLKKITKENKPYLQNISSSRTKALKFKGTKNDWSGAKKKKNLKKLKCRNWKIERLDLLGAYKHIFCMN